MLSLGIDLAAQPKATAICLLNWEAGGPRIEDLRSGIEDSELVDLILSADKVGLDAPLGWPEHFVSTIQRHHLSSTGEKLPERRMLTLRETDRRLQEATGRRPLSVSTDLIGVVALRAIGLQDELASRGSPVDRTGRGRVCEVYPAAALEAWGMGARGYKGPKSRQRLPEITQGLIEGIGGLDFEAADRSGLESDHNQLDAFICALIARAVAKGKSTGPPEEWNELASREGWIHVPETDLRSLRTIA